MAGEGKSAVTSSEWKVEGDPLGNMECVLYVEETVDGKSSGPKAVRRVQVPRPDLTGADLEPALRTCARFGFSVAAMVDDCRAAERERLAKALRSKLIAEDNR